MTPYSNELEAFLYDCGGPSRVAEALGISRIAVWGWVDRGHIPLTDLTGRTSYSGRLAGMQQTKGLSPVDIRRIGLRL